FRRLMHKTQVFLQPEGDHYRTRLTHTLEVARIARTMARALRLNEDLTEAVALGHDLGHTPFGHAGERALAEIMADEGGFKHYEQSLRVVDVIEKDGRGLNLSYEVRNGILRHTNDPLADTLEGRIVRIADRAAYMNHDCDDAIRAGILGDGDIPPEITCALGERYSERINTIIFDVVEASEGRNEIAMSPQMNFVFSTFHSFMNENVYKNQKAKGEESKVFGIIDGIFRYYASNPERLPDDYRGLIDKFGLKRAVCDYVAGMTDKYAMSKFGDIYLPEAWSVK
ncbi:MAG: deoxyguanosinetriphosphate triphosphohydrolase, partial [Oscillospiraceae bacterium]|nr:deoxyguanosinetriphosphate triphosphohydrolase [Oscillospiraceae bacterium]